MVEPPRPFDFRVRAMALESAGRKAPTLTESRNRIEKVGDECLFHHTCRYFLKGRALEYTGDFAHRAGESLEERALSGAPSAVDPFVRSLEDVRHSITEAVEETVRRKKEVAAP